MDSVPAKRNPIVWDFSIHGRHIKILLWLQIQATFPNLSKKEKILKNLLKKLLCLIFQLVLNLAS